MGIFTDNLSEEASRKAGGKTILRAIADLDPKGLEAAIKRGESLDILREDDDEEYLYSHVHLNFFPESDDIEGVKKERDKLARGSAILRILAEHGVDIAELGDDYDKYSLVKLKVGYSALGKIHVYDALWLAHSPEALKAMIAEGNDVNLKDSVERALHYIAFDPDEYFRPDEMVRILLENGAEITEAEYSLGPLKCVAFALKDHAIAAPIMRLLIENGATGSDAIMRKLAGVEDDDLDDVDEYDLRTRAFVDEMIRLMHADSKLTALELDLLTATYTGDAQAVSEILKLKPNVNVQTQDLKYTPLMFAVHARDIKASRALLKAGADPNIQNSLGRTALSEAVLFSDTKLAELLVSYNADPNIKDIHGETPYTLIFSKRIGIFGEDLDIASLFLSCGVNIDSPNRDGDTPLIECLEGYYPDYWCNMMAQEVLIPNGANVNARDSMGRTALMYAARGHKLSVIRSLLNAGADVSLEDDDGDTALGLFLYENMSDDKEINIDIFSLLMSSGVYLGSNVARDFEHEPEDYELVMKALSYYDVEALRKLIEEDRADSLDEVGFQFVVNYVPEPDSEAFREKLNKGAEILRMLHEVDEDFPVKDHLGRELSYISAGWNRFTKVFESNPPKRDALSLQRHAASPIALREVLETDLPEEEPEQENVEPEEDSGDDFPMSDEFMERMSRLFSPADFVTRDDDDDKDELRSQIRASFTPDDFIFGGDDDEDELKGTNILHILALFGENYFDPAEMIRVACEHGFDPNAPSKDGDLLLMLTFWANNALCAYALLKAGADILKEDKKGESSRDKLNGEGYRYINKFREQIFFESLFSEKEMFIEVVRTLLYGRGEASNILIAAAFDGDVRKIRSALNAGADVNVQTQRGFTPLMLAAFMVHPEAVKTLLEAGADVNIRENFGNNVVALTRDLASLRAVADAGAEIDSPDKYGFTPLMFPVFLEKIPVLAELGADLNRINTHGVCALSVALENRNSSMIEALLRAGADPKPLIRRN